MSHKFTVGEYTTRDGRRATVAADRGDGDGVPYPLVGWIGIEGIKSWARDGRHIINEVDEDDLIPPAPEMVRVPLSADDIPQGAEFREIGGDLRMSLSGVEPTGVYMHRIGYINIESKLYAYLDFEALVQCEMRAPGGEWAPCWKEVAK